MSNRDPYSDWRELRNSRNASATPAREDIFTNGSRHERTRGGRTAVGILDREDGQIDGEWKVVTKNEQRKPGFRLWDPGFRTQNQRVRIQGIPAYAALLVTLWRSAKENAARHRAAFPIHEVLRSLVLWIFVCAYCSRIGPPLNRGTSAI